jgi:hypothetical protein
MRVWIAHVTTESGDDYHYTFANKPTGADVKRAMRNAMDDEADYISHWRIYETPVTEGTT